MFKSIVKMNLWDWFKWRSEKSEERSELETVSQLISFWTIMKKKEKINHNEKEKKDKREKNTALKNCQIVSITQYIGITEIQEKEKIAEKNIWKKEWAQILYI